MNLITINCRQLTNSTGHTIDVNTEDRAAITPVMPLTLAPGSTLVFVRSSCSNLLDRKLVSQALLTWIEHPMAIAREVEISSVKPDERIRAIFD